MILSLFCKTSGKKDWSPPLLQAALNEILNCGPTGRWKICQELMTLMVPARVWVPSLLLPQAEHHRPKTKGSQMLHFNKAL